MPYLLIVDACLRTRLGQLPEALASAEKAGEYSRIMHARETAAMADIARLRPTLWRHGQQSALQLANQIARAGRPSAGWWSGLARLNLAEVYLAAGNIETCLTELTGEEADEATASYRWAVRAVASALLGRQSQSRGDAREALRHAERSGLAHQLGVAHDARARVLSSAGDLDAALEAASVAVTHFVAAESPVEEGTARHLLAVLSARTGQPDAMRLELGRAKELYSASSATWLSTVLARDERRFAARGPRPRFSSGNAVAALTAREREVVDLVITGLTNREIAERLHLSRKTVETHLSRAFAKLHVRSRVELTRRLTAESELPNDNDP
jgi:RNA polymerase sigma factor (sigma-70 family)